MEFQFLLGIKHLLSIEGLGPSKLGNLITRFGNPNDVLNASPKELTSVKLIDPSLAKRILSSGKSLSTTEELLNRELNKLEKLNARLITQWDADYPFLLKNIYTPPALLYVIGNFSEADRNSIAMVGTRTPTNYGKSYAEKFAAELAQQGITVISGLARGIDSSAHKGALNAGGRTIAITGAGPDVIYPAENKKLYYEIAEKGVIITEFAPGTKPDAPNFPKRNRIISGLSLGTLVIETRLNGGAMQTASHAIEQNREVFAIPGPINSVSSAGCNMLIQKGEAKLVTNTEDITAELQIRNKADNKTKTPPPVIDLNIFEQKVFDVLTTDAKHIDVIARDTGMDTSECLINLLTLEFKGLCNQLPGKTFIKTLV